MGWFSRTHKEQEDEEVYFSTIEGLKHLYKSKILPVEEMYKFNQVNGSSNLTDADFDAKPQVLLLGQYSVGKTSFIEYLTGGEFPNMHIGPEPTTDRFMAVMHGDKERVTPGNALAVQEDKPFRGLQQFGTAFLSKLECVQCDRDVLKRVSFIDTPGVLSGEKQRIGRAYDFVRVVEWFAAKSDLILLLFDAHKLDISDEFKRTIVSLKPHDEKIRVLLNKADQVDQQQLMRVYGALMWSLGKVTNVPEVKRVFISSYWNRPFQGDNAPLFQKERDDLLKELQSLPKNAAMRKINDLVKRARYVKVHALLIGQIKKQMPSMWGKASAQKTILSNLEDVFRTVQREHHLPVGDFPNIDTFRANIADYDFSKFPKLDAKFVESMDAVLSKELPKLLNQFSPDREQELADAAASGKINKGKSNPFGSSSGGPMGTTERWSIPVADQEKYRAIFSRSHPIDGLLSGDAARAVLIKSKLDVDMLGKIWELSDMDDDGCLDADEFCVAMYLCHGAMKGEPIPDSLPEDMVPPSKRSTQEATSAVDLDDPFGSTA